MEKQQTQALFSESKQKILYCSKQGIKQKYTAIFGDQGEGLGTAPLTLVNFIILVSDSNKPQSIK